MGDLTCLTIRDHSFKTYANISEKLIFLTRTCAYQGVRNFSFLGNFAYIPKEWPLLKFYNFNKTKNLYIMQVGRILESNVDAICKKSKIRDGKLQRSWELQKPITFVIIGCFTTVWLIQKHERICLRRRKVYGRKFSLIF